MFYNVTLVTRVKVCNFFVSYQSVCEVDRIHVDAFHATTDSLMKHWDAISLYRPRILPAQVNHISNFSTYANKSQEVDCQHANLIDASSTIKMFLNLVMTTTRFIVPVLKEKVVAFISFLFMAFVFSFKTIFIFCPTLTFRFSAFIVNSILHYVNSILCTMELLFHF